MSALPEVVFQHLFARVISEAQHNPDLIRHLTRNFGISKQEDVIEYITTQHFKVVTQFPRVDPQYPMIWIALEAEEEAAQALGDLISTSPPLDEIYDSSVYGSGLPGAGSVGNLQGQPTPEIEGDVATADATGLIPVQSLEDAYSGMTVILVTGKGAGQQRKIKSSTANKIILENAWNTIPNSTTTFKIINPDKVNNDNVGIAPSLYHPDDIVYMIGSGFRSTFTVRIMVESNPHAVLVLYTLLKGAIFANKGFLEHNDIVDVIISGSDMAPMPEMLPTHIFSRTLGISCINYLTIPQIIKVPSTLEFAVVLCQDDQEKITVSLE